jgi:hypothetical protein
MQTWADGCGVGGIVEVIDLSNQLRVSPAKVYVRGSGFSIVFLSGTESKEQKSMLIFGLGYVTIKKWFFTYYFFISNNFFQQIFSFLSSKEKYAFVFY